MFHVTAGARHRRPRRRPTACPRVEIDGNDVLAVREAAAEAVARARAGAGPDPARVHDVPPQGPLARRSRQVPAEGGGRRVARRATRCPRLAETARCRRRSSGSRRGSRPSSSSRSRWHAPRRHSEPDPSASAYKGTPDGARSASARRSATAWPRRWSATRASSSSARTSSPAASSTPPRVSSSASASDRVIDTPISELAFTAAAFGAAVKGMRPVVEIMFGDFLGLVIDTLVNQASKYWYLSNEQASVPLVVRSAVGAGARFGACHSQTPTGWFLGEPGLKLVAASNAAGREGPDQGRDPRRQPGDLSSSTSCSTAARARCRTATTRSSPIGQAAVRADGQRTSRSSAALAMVDAALAAAEQLAGEGIEAEVIDLRTLRPLDAGDDRRLGREDRPPRRRRGGPADGRLRGRRHRARGRAGRPDQREARGDARPPDSRSALRSRTGPGRRPPRSSPRLAASSRSAARVESPESGIPDRGL